MRVVSCLEISDVVVVVVVGGCLNEPETLKLERQNCCQQARHTKLRSGLYSKLKRGNRLDLWILNRDDLEISACLVPHWVGKKKRSKEGSKIGRK